MSRIVLKFRKWYGRIRGGMKLEQDLAKRSEKNPFQSVHSKAEPF